MLPSSLEVYALSNVSCVHFESVLLNSMSIVKAMLLELN